MERRQFLGLFGVGMLASSLPIVLAACSGSTETSSEPTDEATDDAENSPIAKTEDAAEMMGDFSIIGTVSNLDAAGDLSGEVNGKKVYVFRNPQDQSLVALDPTCNHKGCPVKVTDTNLTCTCHGSSFAFDGALTKGPATAALPLYEIRQEGENILVKVA